MIEVDISAIAEYIEVKGARHDEDDLEWARAWDDQTGRELKASEVIKARRLEMEYVKKMEVYAPATVEECWKVTGKAPVKSRWLDVNKGDDNNNKLQITLGR